MSKFLKERFAGKNLSDPKSPPIVVPEPCLIPSHFMIASKKKRLLLRNVTPNPKKVAVKSNKSLGGQPPKHSLPLTSQVNVGAVWMGVRQHMTLACSKGSFGICQWRDTGLEDPIHNQWPMQAPYQEDMSSLPRTVKKG